MKVLIIKLTSMGDLMHALPALTDAATQIPNIELKEKVLELFKKNITKFENLYVEMNKICRLQLIKMINSNFKATIEWMEQEFRLEKPKIEMQVPLLLVKAIGKTTEESGADLSKFIPETTRVKAYLKAGSVQEWFIDLFNKKSEKITLLMTIRSDSEYREAKQKGKLGAYTMLKLLYRGIKTHK